MDLNIDAILKLPARQKALGLGGILVVILLIYIYMGYLPQGRELSRKRTQCDQLEAKLAEYRVIADKLAIFEKELEKLNQKLVEALTKLPNKQEIPQLLVNISNRGRETGLDFELFQPKGEVPKGFYADVPVDVKVVGGYHDVATFFDKLSRMDRIVNVTNLSIDAGKVVAGKLPLKISFLLTTFRFIEEATGAKTKKK
ncbi:MAG: type 4a pilus biogenesis protein PilO [Deltaproteobacteria bacterium]|nr:MAG: type 4a pilus biogenesis protein PilO [Deltaproteobacteria bacterium]